MHLCHCGSQQSHSHCCGPLINGQTIAKTPEALMRSRYSAYATGNMRYIQQTMRGEALQAFQQSGAELEPAITWLGLQVIAHGYLSPEKTTAYVEFQAFYRANGQQQVMHERSLFECVLGRWYYTGTQ